MNNENYCRAFQLQNIFWCVCVCTSSLLDLSSSHSHHTVTPTHPPSSYIIIFISHFFAKKIWKRFSLVSILQCNAELDRSILDNFFDSIFTNSKNTCSCYVNRKCIRESYSSWFLCWLVLVKRMRWGRLL